MSSPTIPSKPGLLIVSSKILNPSNLSPSTFCSWYENTHIQEVQATGGISHTHRYESLSFISKHREDKALDGLIPENRNCTHDFLTLYHMPDLSFRSTTAFKGLAGQSRPNEELVKGIFEQAEFCTRFCESIEGHALLLGERENGEPAPYITTMAISTSADPDVFEKFPKEFRDKTYAIREQSILSAFQREYVDQPALIIIFEFIDVPEIEPLQNFFNVESIEIGFWGLRRVYDGSERIPASWPPME